MRTSLGTRHKQAVGRSWVLGFLRVIKPGWRGIVRAPGFAAVATLSLAIPIGANTALFRLMEGSSLRAPPYAEPENLVDIRMFGPNNEYGSFSRPAFHDFEDATKQMFDGVAGAMANRVHLSAGTGWHDSPHHEIVVGPFFQTLGIGAQIGRVFAPDEGVEMDADPVVVLSDTYWREKFAGDSAIVGRTLWLNGFRYTVVGVAAAGFQGLLRGVQSAFWAHATMAGQIYLHNPAQLDTRTFESLLVMGRMSDGIAPADAETAVAAFADSLFATHPGIYPDYRLEVTPTLASTVHPVLDGIVVPVAQLVAGVLSVLLILACLNLAAFLLARAERRRHEVAVYLALGTGRSRLVRSHLTETTMLALLGGAVSVPLSVLLLKAVAAIVVQFPVPVAFDPSLNSTALFLALCLSLLAGFLMGLGPALKSTRPGIFVALHREHVGGPRGATGMRSALLVAQVALTLLLAVAAVGSLRSLFLAGRVDAGFGKHPVAITLMVPGPSRSEGERRAFYEGYLQAVKNIPGVISAGGTTAPPLIVGQITRIGLGIPGVDPPPGHSIMFVDWTGVRGDYFDAMGIPLLAGRFFDARDGAGPSTAVIVSKAMAERFWPDQNPVGQKVIACEGCMVDVAGVVGDTRAHGLFRAPRPLLYTTLYTTMVQSPYFHEYIVARTTGDPSRILPKMIALASELDSLVLTLRATTLEQHRSVSLIPLRVTAVLAGSTSAFALLLAAIGVYGTVSYTVAARKGELAVRMCVGANPSRVAAGVLRSTMKLIAIGIAIGSLLAVVVAHALRDMPYGLRPLNSLDVAGSCVLLAAIGALTALLASRRASRLDPVVALREG